MICASFITFLYVHLISAVNQDYLKFYSSTFTHNFCGEREQQEQFFYTFGKSMCELFCQLDQYFSYYEICIKKRKY